MDCNLGAEKPNCSLQPHFDVTVFPSIVPEDRFLFLPDSKDVPLDI